MLSDSYGGNFTETDTYKINSGDESIDVNVYSGDYIENLRISWHVAATDCTPIAMSHYGQATKEIVLNTFTFQDVVQGSLRDGMDTVELPEACKALVCTMA